MKAGIAVLWSLLLVGCASVYRQAGVASSDASQIAVITAEPCSNHQCLIIQEIDGKWRGIGWFKRYELLPGLKTLELTFMAPGISAKQVALVAFDAQAGQTYFIRENVNYSAMQWNPEVVNSATREVVSSPVRR
jgi:hypothetical protein